jgi:hypothetical protein
MKESNVEHLVGAQSFDCQWRTKIKYQKPVVKVVRDLLTKKWIFVKRNNQVSAKSWCLGNLPPPCKDTQALVMSRCEEGSSRQRKVSTKHMKQGFKVAQNRLTKKWIFQKKDRMLRDVIESTLLLEALGCLYRCRYSLGRFLCLQVAPLASWLTVVQSGLVFCCCCFRCVVLFLECGDVHGSSLASYQVSIYTLGCISLSPTLMNGSTPTVFF